MKSAVTLRSPLARAARKESFAQAIDGALALDARPLHAIGDDMDAGASLLSRCRSPLEPHTLSFNHAAAAANTPSRPIALAAVRWLNDQLRLQPPAARAEIAHGDNHAARLSLVTTECTDVPRALAVALADGELTEDELEAIRLEAAQALDAVLELDAWVAEELRRRRGET